MTHPGQRPRPGISHPRPRGVGVCRSTFETVSLKGAYWHWQSTTLKESKYKRFQHAGSTSCVQPARRLTLEPASAVVVSAATATVGMTSRWEFCCVAAW